MKKIIFIYVVSTAEYARLENKPDRVDFKETASKVCIFADTISAIKQDNTYNLIIVANKEFRYSVRVHDGFKVIDKMIEFIDDYTENSQTLSIIIDAEYGKIMTVEKRL